MYIHIQLDEQPRLAGGTTPPPPPHLAFSPELVSVDVHPGKTTKRRLKRESETGAENKASLQNCLFKKDSKKCNELVLEKVSVGLKFCSVLKTREALAHLPPPPPPPPPHPARSRKKTPQLISL